MRTFLSVLALSSLTLAVLLATPSLAEHRACNSAEPLRSALTALDPDLSGCRSGEPCREAARTRLEELLAEHGFELHLWANLTYLEGRDGVREHEAIAQELTDLAEKRGNDADAWYLAGALTRDEKGEELLKKALEMDPDHPWTHLMMAIRQQRDDKELAAKSLSRFLEQCPSRLRDAKSYPQRVGTPELWRRHLPALEKATATLPEAEHIATLPNLWQMQFAALPLGEHDRVRQQVTQQVAKVHQLERRDSPIWWDTLTEGYELAGNDEALATLKSERTAQFPCQKESVALRIEQVVRKYDPEADDMRIKAKMLDFTPEQLPLVVADIDALDAECAENQAIAGWRFNLLGQQENAPAERVQAVADAYLAANKPSGSLRLSSPEYQVARLFVERGVAMERVPALIEEARANKADLSEVRMPARFRKQMEQSQERAAVHMARLAGEAHHTLGQGEEARREAELASSLYQALDVETHGDKLVEVHEKLTSLWQDTGLPALPAPVLQVEEEEEIAAASWRDVNEPLQDFSLTDLSGQTWTQADLADQGVLINFWATWCMPCIAELPEIQALHEELESVEGLRVVTFNTDRNPGKVKPFLDKRKFSFPVIMATDFLPPESASLPQNWILNRESVVRKKSMGFAVDGPGEWRHDALKVLKEVCGDS